MPEPLKILTVEQIKAADQYTIAHEPISSTDLMERAAKACSVWIQQQYTNEHAVKVFCGMGDNGGDGLAIARLLSRAGYTVDAYIVRHSAKASVGFAANQQRLLAENITEITTNSKLPAIAPEDLVIDALFGIGINREPEGIAAACIKHINAAKGIAIAIDLPSGLRADKHTDTAANAVINAKHTLTFQLPKLALLFPENAAHTGAWHLLDIGLNKNYIQDQPCTKYYLTPAFVSSLIKEKPKFAHKGTFGHAMLIAGSYGKTGAAVLAGKACLRSGAGLLSMHIPGCGYDIVQTTIPEAMADTDTGQHHLQDLVKTQKYNSIGVGPGIGTEPATQQVVQHLLQNSTAPLILDADALNILAIDKTRLYLLPENSILTPHPKEFERIAHSSTNDFERHELQLNFSKEYKVYVVLKGAHTCVTTPEGNAYFNATGNPGMAKGGSGDVLTGLLTGLVAQGYTPLHACILGVYIHGLAGDIAAENLGQTSMIAGDIIDFLPKAFIKTEQKKIIGIST